MSSIIIVVDNTRNGKEVVKYQHLETGILQMSYQ